MNEQAENLPRGNGSVGADYNVIGVRPSSGAASTGCSDASDSIGARSRSDIAAPEDGRTPPRRSPAVADPVQFRWFEIEEHALLFTPDLFAGANKCSRKLIHQSDI